MIQQIIGQQNDIPKTCAIIMPTYNEEETLPAVVEEWSTLAKQINGMLVVINDGSKDGTLPFLKEACQHNKRLIVIDKKNSGHGPSCLLGYRWAFKEGFAWIFQTDSDGQVKSREFFKAWDLRDQHDFIFGLRSNRRDGWIRYFISRILRVVILFIFGVNVPDSNVPFRLMNRETLGPYLKIIPDQLYLANAYLAILLQRSPQRIHWIEISFYPRQGGTPSVRLLRFFKVGLKVTKEFMAMRKEFNLAVTKK